MSSRVPVQVQMRCKVVNHTGPAVTDVLYLSFAKLCGFQSCKLCKCFSNSIKVGDLTIGVIDLRDRVARGRRVGLYFYHLFHVSDVEVDSASNEVDVAGQLFLAWDVVGFSRCRFGFMRVVWSGG